MASETRENLTGGSAAGGGFEYQAKAIAYASAHILTAEPLNWVEAAGGDVPLAVAAEVGGPGDDFRLELGAGTSIEVQAKRGLQKGKDFWEALIRLVRGLQADPNIYGVLLVDLTASGTIRNELRDDLKRFSQGRVDGLRPITLELLERLKPCEPILFQRLSIVIFDPFGPPDAEKVARGLLGRVVAAGRAGDAWSALVEEGHRLIRLRGRRSAEELLRYLSHRRIPLSAEAGQVAVLGERYRQWLIESTRVLHIPGISKTLPINKAWLRLRAQRHDADPQPRRRTLEEWIAAYREWDRLGASDAEDGFEAQHLAQVGQHVVVVGGPGSGKSTLLRWLAHRFSSEGLRVARVSLPSVLARQQSQGESFEEALRRTAGDSSGLGAKALEQLLSEPDFLLADGFDECEPQRAAVAEHLVSWASGHPHTTIILTTRPVGHEPGMLPGWKHVELLPLNRSDVSHHARQLLELIAPAAELDSTLRRFEHELERSLVGAMAARNPLLLGFLVQIFYRGEDIGQRRAGLYRAVLSGAQHQAVLDQKKLTQVEPILARRVLELAAWHLQQAPAQSAGMLVERLGEILVEQLKIPPLAASSKAQEGLSYWEERRILERLKSGTEELLTVVHAGLGEYAAASHLARLSEAERHPFIEQVRRVPRWREVLLLTAGVGKFEELTQQLLALDEPSDPVSTEALLAAAAIEEVETPSAERVRAIAQQLEPRIQSTIPLVAFEAAGLCLPLASRFPDIFGPMAIGLCDSTLHWTRVSAVRLMVACGPRYIDAERLKAFLEEEVAIPEESTEDRLRWFRFRGRRPGHHFESDAVLAVVEHLVQQGMTSELLTLVGGLSRSARFKASMGVRLWRLNLRSQQGPPQQVGDDEHPLADSPPHPEDAFEFDPLAPVREAERAFLEAVLRVTSGRDGGTTANAESEEPVELATLLEGMGWSRDLSLDDLVVLRQRDDLEAVDAVIRGMIGVLGLKPMRLSSEAHQLLAHPERTLGAEALESTWFAGLPRVPADAHWEAARELDLPAEPLIRALIHPSDAMTHNGFQLLLHGAGGAKASALLEEQLLHLDESLASLIARLAPAVWGRRAHDLLLPLLEGSVNRTHAPLFASLPELYRMQPSPRLLECLLRGLESPDALVAMEAAESLRKLAGLLPLDIAPRLSAAAEHWAQKGTWCEQDQVPSRSEFCPKCGRSQPTPRIALLKTLERLGAISPETGLRLLGDESIKVRQIALDSLLRAPSVDTLRVLLHWQEDGSLTTITTILEQVLSQDPALLRGVQDELVSLLRSPSSAIREIIIEALAGASWIERAQAMALARAALDDPSTHVRDQAVLTLRALRA